MSVEDTMWPDLAKLYGPVNGLLELYDRDGKLTAKILAVQDPRDATKWVLAEHVSLGDRQVETALMRLGDGSTIAVPPSVFPSSVPINVLFLSVPDA